jgi:hypothetical protein
MDSSDKPRFLAPMGKPRDYVDNPAMAMRNEPECIGPAIVDGYASIASFHRSQQHALHVAEAQLIRPTLPPESRLSDLRRRAKHSRVDMSHELHIIEREVRKAQMRGQDVPQRVVERLEKLEGLLDGIAA